MLTTILKDTICWSVICVGCFTIVGIWIKEGHKVLKTIGFIILIFIILGLRYHFLTGVLQADTRRTEDQCRAAQEEFKNPPAPKETTSPKQPANDICSGYGYGLKTVTGEMMKIEISPSIDKDNKIRCRIWVLLRQIPGVCDIRKMNSPSKILFIDAERSIGHSSLECPRNLEILKLTCEIRSHEKNGIPLATFVSTGQACLRWYADESNIDFEVGQAIDSLREQLKMAQYINEH